MVMPARDAHRRRHDRVAGGGHHLADLQHDLAGVERLAGRVRRAHRGAAPADGAGVGVEELLPGEVLDRRRAEGLEVGLHEVRHGLHRALGPVLVLQVHVHRRRDHVPELRGRQDDQERDEGGEVDAPQPRWAVLQVARRRAVEQRRERVPDERPLLEVGTTDLGDAQRLGEEAGERDHEERDEDDRVLGLGLDADAVRPFEVAPGDRPDDADGEHDAGEVGRERVALVHAAVEELEVVGELVVELEHDGGDEEPQEAEVDERVHEAGGRVAQQRLHPHAGPEVLHAPVEVALGGAAVVGRAPLVVLDPLADQPRADEQHDRGGHVERPVHGVGDAAERLARDRASVSAHSVIRGAMPEASVPSATSTPTTSTRWCGFGSGRRFTARKVTAHHARGDLSERSERRGSSSSALEG